MKVLTNLLLILTLNLTFFSQTHSQEKPELPEFMTLIETTSGKLQDKILAAQKRFRSESKETKFWVGYRFEPRTDIELRKKAIFWLGQSNDAKAKKALLEIINQ